MRRHLEWLFGVVAKQRLRRLGGIAILWAAYVATIEIIGSAVARDESQRVNPIARERCFHGFIADLTGVPALARWDSIWYYGIANEGYAETGPEARAKAAFLPLFPFLMRVGGTIANTDYFRAGIWVSRLSLLAALLLLPKYLADRGYDETELWPVLATGLAFPMAFILASAYTESLFIALVLATFILAHHRWVWAAAGTASLAALTRDHGLALAPALFALSWGQWRAGIRSIAVFLPAMAIVATYAALICASATQLGDPWRHFQVRRESWGQELTVPWAAIEKSLADAERAVEYPDLGAVYPCLELPCFWLLVYAALLLWEQRLRAEAVYVACGIGLSLCSGSLAATPRYTLALFPALVVLARIHRYPALWYSYLIGATLMQACLLVEYVNFRGLPP